MDVLK